MARQAAGRVETSAGTPWTNSHADHSPKVCTSMYVLRSICPDEPSQILSSGQRLQPPSAAAHPWRPAKTHGALVQHVLQSTQSRQWYASNRRRHLAASCPAIPGLSWLSSVRAVPPSSRPPTHPRNIRGQVASLSKEPRDATPFGPLMSRGSRKHGTRVSRRPVSLITHHLQTQPDPALTRMEMEC